MTFRSALLVEMLWDSNTKKRKISVGGGICAADELSEGDLTTPETGVMELCARFSTKNRTTVGAFIDGEGKSGAQ